MADEQTELQRLSAALAAIDSATSSIGESTTLIQGRITDLLNQIATADNSETIKALADQALAEAGKLGPLAATLSSIANDPANPVPAPTGETNLP